MMFIRNSVVVCILPGPVYADTAETSSDAGSTCIPVPGAIVLTITRPMTRAIVETASK